MRNKRIKQMMTGAYKEKIATMYYCKKRQNIELIVRFLSGDSFFLQSRIGEVSLTANQLKGK